MHAPFDSTNSCFFPSKTNYTKVSKVLFDICSLYKDISVTSLIAMKTETHI